MPATRRYMPRNPLPPISLERTRTADDTDGATQQTVQKMCELIQESVKDPLVQRCAAYAKKHFSCGSSDPADLAWGVFWYVKSCVKFRSDEGTMLQVGEGGSQDLLISPAVLVRMNNPSEDCDGFTMLTAALLTVLGVPSYIVTVATDLDDPRRWSHVFLCANINGRIIPLDTSHGKAPGWMVPRDRINRFQAWTLDGRPADVKIPNFQGLHGYVHAGFGGVRPRRGIGCLDLDVETGICLDAPALNPFSFLTPTPTPIIDPETGLPVQPNLIPSLPTTITPIAGTPNQTQFTPAQLAAIIAQSGNAAVSLIRTASGGPYQVSGTNLIYNPATGLLSGAGNLNPVNFSGLSTSIMSNLPLIGGALLLILVLPSLMGGRR